MHFIISVNSNGCIQAGIMSRYRLNVRPAYIHAAYSQTTKYIACDTCKNSWNTGSSCRSK